MLVGMVVLIARRLDQLGDVITLIMLWPMLPMLSIATGRRRSRAEVAATLMEPLYLSTQIQVLHGWGGPLPQSWIDDQLILQKKILARMYDFGMSPVLPAFSGNVPLALRSKFPSAKVTRLGNWFSIDSDPRWCCTYLLDATDNLFIEIGKAFMEQQFKEYGRTSHIYNCDTFDENTPPVDDPKYISSFGAAIYRGMQSGDDDAIWLMQVKGMIHRS